ncbi:hypothetical protein CP97_15080 (plasmid) [Aurantiacibacter atlanticus]|uniref:Uncharacterized protein n=1 Tax=Aurantiacibacter atlanticus TaxID=1648404 RepID=A0A161I4M2_9SPHN|nr:hypothetical protein CP97_15080 [Aurantiacibacter atlanticus]
MVAVAPCPFDTFDGVSHFFEDAWAVRLAEFGSARTQMAQRALNARMG